MNQDFDQQLLSLRNEIDEIDSKLVALINHRARCAQKAGELKAHFDGGSISYRPEREAEVLRRVQQLNSGPLPDENLAVLFRELMSACLSLEQTLRVAFLGLLGTFSEDAAIKHFGRAVKLFPQTSIDDIFHEVEAGRADFAVIPVESSAEGTVGCTLDFLISTPLKVCGEVNVRIWQHLLSNETSLEKITRVYSPARSLALCCHWLQDRLPHAQRLLVASNAEAVQQAATEAGSAAIAGEAASLRCSLPKLVSNIEDNPNATARFLVLGRQTIKPSGHDKTSIIVSAPDIVESLSSLLAPFYERGISMTHLESRKVHNSLWDYVFFVDIKGHQGDNVVSDALASLRQRTAWLKVLGSYPVAVC
jgi:chorismate mutase/prephenate dehydratase